MLTTFSSEGRSHELDRHWRNKLSKLAVSQLTATLQRPVSIGQLLHRNNDAVQLILIMIM